MTTPRRVPRGDGRQEASKTNTSVANIARRTAVAIEMTADKRNAAIAKAYDQAKAKGERVTGPKGAGAAIAKQFGVSRGTATPRF